jgi:hypothetical protein
MLILFKKDFFTNYNNHLIGRARLVWIGRYWSHTFFAFLWYGLVHTNKKSTQPISPYPDNVPSQ